MRRPSLPVPALSAGPALAAALALLFAVAAPAAVASAAASPAGAPANATLSGTVRGPGGPAGGATVLAQRADDSLFADLALDRAVLTGFRKLAATDPDGVWTATAGPNGTYALSVPPGRYDLVAFDGGAVSEPRTLGVEGTRTAGFVLSPTNLLAAEATDARTSEPGPTTVTVTLENRDEDPVRNLTLAVRTAAEDPVSLAGSGNATVADGAVRWRSVAPGETVTLRVTVDVTAAAERRRIDLDVTGRADSHFVETLSDPTVVVVPPDATPTPTAYGGDGGEMRTAAGTVTATDTPETSMVSSADSAVGIGAVVVVAALVALALWRR